MRLSIALVASFSSVKHVGRFDAPGGICFAGISGGDKTGVKTGRKFQVALKSL
jgi:hypothetical protein